jgi:hypothetical protein
MRVVSGLLITLTSTLLLVISLFGQSNAIAAGSELADGRVYEMVSPADKTGGTGGVLPLNSVSAALPIQSSAGGEKITWGGAPFYEPAGGGTDQYLSAREAAGWTTRNITPPSLNNEGSFYAGFTSNLSSSLFIGTARSTLAPAGYLGPYVRNDLTGEYTPLFKSLPAGRTFSSLLTHFAGASTDFRHVIFEANVALTPEAPEVEEEAYDLYEWSEGSLRLVNVLNNGEGVPGASFGTFYRGFSNGPNVTNAISADGTRIFWTGDEKLYVRENGTQTVEVDESHGSATSGGGEFLDASEDGSHVLFLDKPGLAEDNEEGGMDLYDYNVETGQLSNLTPVSEASVVGFLGASADASYVYFVAEGALPSAPSSTASTATPTPGQPNLYLWHEGEPIQFVATLSNNDQFGRGYSSWNPTLGNRLARVSPNGQFAAFYTTRPLTGYDNAVAPGHTCLATLQPDCAEVYEYSAQSGALICASCNSDGAPPIGDTLPPAVAVLTTATGQLEDAVYQQRYLLDDGRLFFDTGNALAPQDINGTEDVYEYEPAGVGDCVNGKGCDNLMSAGTGPYPSEFADASEDGDNLFFTTRQQLTPEDQDELIDLYDAHVGGGFPALSTPAPCLGEACHGASEAQGPPTTPSSTSYSGPGNAAQRPLQTPVPKPPTSAQRLAAALRMCRKKQARKRRVACEAQARKRYAPPKAKTRKAAPAKAGR